jgi:hypothetical protein
VPQKVKNHEGIWERRRRAQSTLNYKAECSDSPPEATVLHVLLVGPRVAHAVMTNRNITVPVENLTPVVQVHWFDFQQGQDISLLSQRPNRP